MNSISNLFPAFALLYICSLHSYSQSYYFFPLNKNPKHIAIELFSMDTITGLLLHLNVDTIAMWHGDIVGTYGLRGIYQFDSISTTELDSIEFISFKKDRSAPIIIGALLGGATVGIMVGFVNGINALTGQEEYTSGLPVLAGVAAGGTIGWGISRSLNPKRSRFPSKEKLVRKLVNKLNWKARWSQIPPDQVEYYLKAMQH